MSGCSSVVEHNLAKVGVEGSNPFARSKFPFETILYQPGHRAKTLDSDAPIADAKRALSLQHLSP